mgnify:CR=1 FL=1
MDEARLSRMDINIIERFEDEPLVSVVIPTWNRKEKLKRCIDSILANNYQNKEIIVVDDYSDDGTPKAVREWYPMVKLVESKEKLLLAGARNRGILESKGEFIFLIDDDNVIASDAISVLAKAMLADDSLGIAFPLTFYYNDPNVVWADTIDRNMFTSKTLFKGRGKIYSGEIKGPLETKEVLNAFMIRKSVFQRVGLFDDRNFPICYDEADFSQRVLKAQYKILTFPGAKVWHDIVEYRGIRTIYIERHIRSELNAYYLARNRIIFHKLYSNKTQLLIFLLIFLPLFIIYYLIIILIGKLPFKNRLKSCRSYLEGTIDGLRKQFNNLD